MALSDEIIADIAEEATELDSLNAMVAAFVKDGSITPAAADQIRAAFAANKVKLSDLVTALQPAAPPTP
jgi:hypothetical protein